MTDGALNSWMKKHFTRENPKSLKCDYCGKSFLDQRDQRQILKNHLCDVHNVTELNGYREGDILRQNYKISGQTATCNHCNKKIVFTHNASLLKTHLKIDHPDKCNLIDRNVRKSSIWKEFTVTGNYATCKNCKVKCKLRSIKPTRFLWKHLKIVHPYIYNSLSITIPIRVPVRRNRHSNVWDNYTITGNWVICKTCNITLRYNSKNPGYLWRHLKSKRCQAKASKSKSIENNEFHSTMILQSEMETFDETKLFQQEIEETNLGDATSTSRSVEDNDFNDIMEFQSETQAFDQTKSIKPEIGITGFHFV